MKVYHKTDHAAASCILRDGFEDRTGTYLTRHEYTGVWVDAKPVAPWDWRAARRAKANVPPTDIEIVENGISIAALLPNPKGQDAGHEQVTIANTTKEPIDLNRWRLVDKASNVFLLKGTAKPK